MLRNGHGGLYKAPTKEDRTKRKAIRRERERERSDQVYDLRFDLHCLAHTFGFCCASRVYIYKLLHQGTTKLHTVNSKNLNSWHDEIFIELRWGKAMVAYKKPQQRKKEGQRPRGERDQIKYIDLRFERWQVVGFKKARRRQQVP